MACSSAASSLGGRNQPNASGKYPNYENYYNDKLRKRAGHCAPHYATRNLRAARLQREDFGAAFPGKKREAKGKENYGKSLHYQAFFGYYLGYAYLRYTPLLFGGACRAPRREQTRRPEAFEASTSTTTTCSSEAPL